MSEVKKHLFISGIKTLMGETPLGKVARLGAQVGQKLMKASVDPLPLSSIFYQGPMCHQNANFYNPLSPSPLFNQPSPMPYPMSAMSFQDKVQEGLKKIQGMGAFFGPIGLGVEMLLRAQPGSFAQTVSTIKNRLSTVSDPGAEHREHLEKTIVKTAITAFSGPIGGLLAGFLYR